MKRLFPVLVFVFVACSTKAAVGPAGPAGAQGLAGSQGPKGDSGAAGVCDTSSCPQVTSINGLSGGTVSGAVAFSGGVTLSSVEISSGSGTPKGVVVESGGKMISVGGFWCGTTMLVDGTVYVQGVSTGATNYNALSPKRRAKQLCEDTCGGNAAAHPCLTSEIQNAQFLRGGGGVGANAAVPMPPANPGSGWVLSPNPIDSCNDLTGDSSKTGVIYQISVGDEGSFTTLACNDATHGLYCCL